MNSYLIAGIGTVIIASLVAYRCVRDSGTADVRIRLVIKKKSEEDLEDWD